MTARGLAGPAALMMACRLLNMVVGLAMIPALVHALGGQEFGAWAILLSVSAFWNELELGVSPALVKHLSVALHAGKPGEATRVVSAALTILAAVYALAVPLALLWGRGLAEWLRLPATPTLSPSRLLATVLVGVALRSVLLTGTYSLLAARRFGTVAALALLQPMVSNLAATFTALGTRDLGLTLLAFWAAQLAVVGVGFGEARRRLGWRFSVAAVDVATLRGLLSYGLRVQVHEWAQTVNFQFDKLVIVRLLGLWPAALYEVANRSVLALRSIPASGIETFLPTASIEAAEGGSAGERLRRMAVLSAYGILVFFAAPLAIAPVFLYAWVGEMGYVSRWTFVALGLGASANLFALPLATLAQASGRPGLPARAAFVSMLVNVPLSLAFVRVWGVEGAALGTALAMVVGFAVLLRGAVVTLGDTVASTLRHVVERFTPLFATCAVFGVAVHWAFTSWLEALSPAMRYGVGLRTLGALAAAGLYAGCLASLAAVKAGFLGLDDAERGLLLRSRQVWAGWRSPAA